MEGVWHLRIISGDIAMKGSLVCKWMKEPSALISENKFFMHRKLLRQEPSGRFMEESGETGNGAPCQVGTALGDYSEREHKPSNGLHGAGTCFDFYFDTAL